MIQNKIQEQIVLKIKNLVPQKIGVYIFFNFQKSVIYIGKSVNLKKRMLNYFQQNNYEPRMKQMIFNIRDFIFSPLPGGAKPQARAIADGSTTS